MRSGTVVRLVAGAIALVWGGFSLFVGYNKALAPLAVLAEHTAWTVHLPEPLGRAIGWAEITAALILIGGSMLPRLTRAAWWAAAWITANHAVAAVIHYLHQEWSTQPQSAVMITLGLLLMALLARIGASQRE